MLVRNRKCKFLWHWRLLSEMYLLQNLHHFSDYKIQEFLSSFTSWSRHQDSGPRKSNSMAQEIVSDIRHVMTNVFVSCWVNSLASPPWNIFLGSFVSQDSSWVSSCVFGVVRFDSGLLVVIQSRTSALLLFQRNLPSLRFGRSTLCSWTFSHDNAPTPWQGAISYYS